MRILLAFIITVIIYMVLIALYLLYFQNIKLSTPKKEKEFEHIIKIDIRDIPRYVEKVAPKVSKQEAKKKIKKEPKKRVTKKNIPKKVTPKKEINKKETTKKVIAKKVTPKKIVKKREAVKKEAVKKIEPKISKKTVIEPSSPIFIEKEIEEYTPEIIEVEEERIFEEEIIYEYFPQEPIQESIMDESIAPPTDDVIAEEEMLYIPNPITSDSESSKTGNSLSSLLGQSSTPVRNRPQSPLIQKLYGASFDSFTPIQKRFIVDKLSSIHRITQSTLTRRGYPAGAVAMQTGQEGENIVSFDLHPNGDISNLRLEREIGYRALDENTLQTIRIAYKDYPYPRETTHIVFYVEYSIFGY